MMSRSLLSAFFVGGMISYLLLLLLDALLGGFVGLLYPLELHLGVVVVIFLILLFRRSAV